MSDPPAKKTKTDPYAKWQSARDETTCKVYYYHADTKATSWTWPPPLDDDAADTPAATPDFEASATYEGRRPGRVFKRGDRGQGYYRDGPLPTAALPGNLSFYPSKTFAGHKPGMVFRRGDRGQGYYRDNPFGGVPVGQRCERYNPHA